MILIFWSSWCHFLHAMTIGVYYHIQLMWGWESNQGLVYTRQALHQLNYSSNYNSFASILEERHHGNNLIRCYLQMCSSWLSHWTLAYFIFWKAEVEAATNYITSTQCNAIPAILFIHCWILRTYRPEETGLSDPAFSNSWAFAATLKDSFKCTEYILKTVS